MGNASGTYLAFSVSQLLSFLLRALRPVGTCPRERFCHSIGSKFLILSAG